MRDGERQVAPTRDGIRRDHVARYEWAVQRLGGAGLKVLDVACGVGYGAAVMAEAGHTVIGVDRDAEAIAYGREHYERPGVEFVCAEAESLAVVGFGAAVCFETIEHLEDPLPLLRALHRAAPLLFASVPNEEILPFIGQHFHFRHYTPGEFGLLLKQAGWEVVKWWGQHDAESEVEEGRMGRTIGVIARHAGTCVAEAAPAKTQVPPLKGRKRVAILGLGPSVDSYTHMCKRAGGRQRLFDEVWTINALGNVFDCDRVFHMDDVRIQQIRADAKPESNIAAMLEWLKEHPGPVYTSRTHPEYPGLVEFPLEDVLNDLKYDYFNSTAAWAVAMAIHLGAEKITIFGNDFTYPNVQDAEKGRACVEFWLGVAAARGIKLAIPQRSSLMDSCVPKADKLYGYDTVHVGLDRGADGRIVVGFTPREKLPSAEEIEHRYDHSRHPSPLVEHAPKEA